MKKIVICVDENPINRSVCEYGLSVAKEKNCECILLYVIKNQDLPAGFFTLAAGGIAMYDQQILQINDTPSDEELSRANAVLDELSALKSNGKLDEKITEFAKNLDHLTQKFDSLIQKRVGLGLMQGLVLRDETNLNKIWQKALENHLLILKSGKKTLRFLPALNIKKSAIAQGFARLEKTLNEI